MATIDTPHASNLIDALPGFPGAALAITPSDDDTFAKPVTVYVGGDGDVAILPANGGEAVTFVGLVAGSVVPCRAIGVLGTGTTATNLVAVY
jgi:hypothetical protein